MRQQIPCSIGYKTICCVAARCCKAALPPRPGWRCRASPSRAIAAPSTPLHFIGWQYNPQIVAENVDIFKKLYDENVDYELVSGEYHAIAETKLMAGQHVDMMYSEEDHLVRWWRAKWVARHRGHARRAGDQGDHVRGQRARPVAAEWQTRRPALLQRLQLVRFQREASGGGQAAAAYDVGRVPRPVPQAEEGRCLRVPLCQCLAAAMGEPVVEPVLGVVLRGRAGLRRQERAGVRRQVQAGAANAPHPLLRRSGAAGHLHPRPGERASLRHRQAHLHGRARIRPEGLQRSQDVADCRAPCTT